MADLVSGLEPNAFQDPEMAVLKELVLLAGSGSDESKKREKYRDRKYQFSASIEDGNLQVSVTTFIDLFVE